MNRENESCSVCGEATGRAGRADDSIFCDCCERGPFCEECYTAHRLPCVEAQCLTNTKRIVALEAERDAARAEAFLATDSHAAMGRTLGARIAALEAERPVWRSLYYMAQAARTVSDSRLINLGDFDRALAAAERLVASWAESKAEQEAKRECPDSLYEKPWPDPPISKPEADDA